MNWMHHPQPCWTRRLDRLLRVSLPQGPATLSSCWRRRCSAPFSCGSLSLALPTLKEIRPSSAICLQTPLLFRQLPAACLSREGLPRVHGHVGTKPSEHLFTIRREMRSGLRAGRLPGTSAVRLRTTRSFENGGVPTAPGRRPLRGHEPGSRSCGHGHHDRSRLAPWRDRLWAKRGWSLLRTDPVGPSRLPLRP